MQVLQLATARLLSTSLPHPSFLKTSVMGSALLQVALVDTSEVFSAPVMMILFSLL
jgi:hypothetical protein